jgi:hypothetical protein
MGWSREFFDVIVQTGALQVLFRREITTDHENRIVAPAFSLELVHVGDQVKVDGGHYRLPWRIAQPARALFKVTTWSGSWAWPSR